jgi:triosephosphate isomerase
MTRKQIVAGNWKMHKTHVEARAWAEEVVAGLRGGLTREAVLCPPFTALPAVAEGLSGSSVSLGAQNVHWEDSGAYTGEISASMLVALGCLYVIVGHSERRQYFGETDATVALKLGAVAKAGMIPILCVGETLEQRERDKTEAVVKAQLAGALGDWKVTNPGALVVAYEPVWAIGTGVTATREQAQEVHAKIRVHLSEAFGEATAAGMRILYGGSVKPDNASALLGSPDIDGALVGGASLKADSFLGICGA